MSNLHALIQEYKVDPKRSLGQNFLRDECHLEQIVAAADLTATDTVLEIGPGLGALTRHLVEQAGRVVAVELDDRLIPLLTEKYADQPHVSIVHSDILKTDLKVLIEKSEQPPAFIKGGIGKKARVLQYKVVANLPYYITSAILRHLLESKAPPQLAVLLVQKEVAQRICQQPGKLSILAISVQFYAHPQIVHQIPAAAFYPRPKVDSSVLRLDVRDAPAVPDVHPADFFKVVRAGFGKKRKQLINSLSSGLGRPKEETREFLLAAEVEPKRRAETLSLDEWGKLTKQIYP